MGTQLLGIGLTGKALTELERRISADRRTGLNPMCIVANAGTVNTGAVDPLDEVRLRQVQLVKTALVGDAAGVEQGAHGAVDQQRAAGQALEERMDHGEQS